MDISCSLGTRSIPRAATVGKVLAGLLGVAALAGIYPVAATIATAMATTLRADKAEPVALVVVSTGAAERNSLGLRTVLSYPLREE